MSNGITRKDAAASSSASPTSFRLASKKVMVTLNDKSSLNAPVAMEFMGQPFEGETLPVRNFSLSSYRLKKTELAPRDPSKTKLNFISSISL